MCRPRSSPPQSCLLPILWGAPGGEPSFLAPGSPARLPLCADAPGRARSAATVRGLGKGALSPAHPPHLQQEPRLDGWTAKTERQRLGSFPFGEGVGSAFPGPARPTPSAGLVATHSSVILLHCHLHKAFLSSPGRCQRRRPLVPRPWVVLYLELNTLFREGLV